MPKDKSLSFRLDEPATKIVVAQPDIAEVVATTDRSFYVRGLDVGSTNLLVYGPGGRLMQVIDVRVGADAQSIERDLAVALPNEHIKVQSLGEGILLTGDVSSPGVVLRAKAIADKLAPDGVTSMLRTVGAQVVLEVRILEATRLASQDIGLGGSIGNNSVNFSFGNGLISNSPANGILSFTGRSGNTTIDATLQALESKGVIRTLARPNLVALSGEKASFLAGKVRQVDPPAWPNRAAMHEGNQRLIICNGYKDDDYIRLALLGRKLGKKVIIVVEQLSELDEIINTDQIQAASKKVQDVASAPADVVVLRGAELKALGYRTRTHDVCLFGNDDLLVPTPISCFKCTTGATKTRTCNKNVDVVFNDSLVSHFSSKPLF